MSNHQAQTLPIPSGTQQAKEQSRGLKGGSQRHVLQKIIFCMGGFILMALGNSVLNTAVFTAVATYAPYGREVAILFGAAGFVGFYLVTTRKPRWLSMSLFTILAGIGVILGTVLLEIAIPVQQIPLTLLGLVLVRLSSTWAVILLAVAVVQLPSKRHMLLCTVWGIAIGEIVRTLLVIDSLAWGIIVESICYIGVGVLLAKMATPVIAQLSCDEPPVDVEVVNPESFLPLGNAIYPCILVFNIVLGFALTLNEGAFNPTTLGITAMVITAIALWFSVGKSFDREDNLFSFCVLIAVAGFLIAPFTFFSGATTANTLLGIGARAFELLVWLAVLSVGRRNILALIPSFALMRATSSLGTTIGAVAGHTSTALVGEGSVYAMFITNAALFIFIVILWLCFRNFSFSRAIQGVACLSSESVSESVDLLPLKDDMEKLELRSGQPIGSAQKSGVRQPLKDVGDNDPHGSNSFDDPCCRNQPLDQRCESHANGSALRDTATAMSPCATEDSAFVSETVKQADQINERCEELGKLHHLTPREIEIFALLARGRNGSFIMEHFVISRNTAKSHIKHIYTKLGVHSQQELIDLVEKP